MACRQFSAVHKKDRFRLMAMRNSALLRSLLAVLASVACPVAAFAQADLPRQVQAYFMWRTLTAGPPDNPVCYVTHQAEAVQAGQRDGPRPMLMVSWRPA